MHASILKTLALSALAVAATLSANALTFTDVDLDGRDGEPDWTYLNNRGGDTWRATFDLLEDGFDPLTMRLIQATVYFAFADDGDRSYEHVKVKVGRGVLWNQREVDGSHRNAPYSYDWLYTSLDALRLAELQDGVIDYSVQAKRGDFYLKEARLVAEAERIDVPDSGATVAMLGLGLGVMVVLFRQMRNR